MTQIGSVYGEALYALAQEENLSKEIYDEVLVLDQSFRQEPDFIRLLSSSNLSKPERCQILDDSFRGKVQPFVLNFLKILAEKGYMKHFHDCRKAYEAHYNQDNGILTVTAVTAVAMSAEQTAKLTDKLSGLTGKHIKLENRIDPACLGGVRLDYDGKRLDDTVSHRLEAVRKVLQNTVL